VTPGRRRRVDDIPEEQAAVVGVNIRTLRQRKGWSQAKLGELMGWPSASTVCAAEGRRDGRQRGFTTREIERLSSIFGISSRQLTTRCVNCGGHPPSGFACLICGAALDATARHWRHSTKRPQPAHDGEEGQRTVTTTEGDIASQEWSIPGPHTA
jgi:transcriptional regulator with XRE-family HTH domain